MIHVQTTKTSNERARLPRKENEGKVRHSICLSVHPFRVCVDQVERATQLAKEQDVPNAKFQVTNALDMSFEDNTFDLVWACESGEHMPDKGKYIDEMTRVLKPGG